ncbi:MAG: hypothetical protein ACYCW6_09585 [Candidatus Xenobia bacterium]
MPRGMTLGTTLMIAALAATVIFTLAGVSFSELHAGYVERNAQTARLLASSAIEEAIYDLQVSNCAFGQQPVHTALGPDTWQADTVRISDPAGDVALLTFRHDAKRHQAPVPWSTNNYQGGGSSSSAPGFGRVVPEDSVDLLATGYCGAEVRTVEALLRFPPFPYAVACGSTLQLQGPEMERFEASQSVSFPLCPQL